MIISKKNYTIKKKVHNQYNLHHLYKTIKRIPKVDSTYMGIHIQQLLNHQTNNQSFQPKVLLIYFMHLLMLSHVSFKNLKMILSQKKQLQNNINFRGQHGTLVADYQTSTILFDKQTEKSILKPRKFYLNRIYPTTYHIETYSKGIWIGQTFYKTNEHIRLVEGNQWAVAVAGINTLSILQNDQKYNFNKKVKKMKWGPQGLYVITEDNNFILYNETKYSKKKYLERVLQKQNKINDESELVNCENLLCIISKFKTYYTIQITHQSNILEVQYQQQDYKLTNFGSYWYQNQLYVYEIYGEQERYHENIFQINM